ncbi:MAG: CinA family protein [Candidatus Nanopelagicaceae bacterium]|jgi:nicotinamide-nucleotide amidase
MIAASLLAELRRRGETVAVAESITGGAIASAFTEIPGASEIFLGGVVAYGNDAKVNLLGIAPELIESEGVVSREVASAMAIGARQRFQATWGIATTGVAGPGPHDGIAAGEVWIAISGPKEEAQHLSLGELGRLEVRGGAVTGALALLSRILRQDS